MRKTIEGTGSYPMKVIFKVEPQMISRVKYAADLVMSQVGCEISLLMAMPKGPLAVSPALVISGSEGDVRRGRRLLKRMMRRGLLTVWSDSTCDSPLALSITRLTLDEEGLSNGEDGNSPVSFPPSPIIDDVEVDLGEMEMLQLSQQAEDDRQIGLFAKEIRVRPEVACALSGEFGDQQLQSLLVDGVLLEVSGRISEEGEREGGCRVFLTAPTAEKIGRAEERIKDLQRASVARRTIHVNENTIEWLLEERRSQLEDVLNRFGTILLRESEDSLTVFGVTELLVSSTIRALEKSTFDHHSLNIWVSDGEDANVSRAIEVAVQGSGALAIQVGSFVSLCGTSERLLRALRLLHQHDLDVPGQIQLKYRIRNDENIREFISGKKDGKLIKIMKETTVSIGLQSSGDQQKLTIELTGDECLSILSALEMLLGEFPAELFFYLDDSHHKRLIGHGGKNIQKVMKKHAVYIKFLNPDEAEEEASSAIIHDPYQAPNVIIRTPAKNKAALQGAKLDIHAMVEEYSEGGPICQEPSGVLAEETIINASRHGILKDAKQREALLRFKEQTGASLRLVKDFDSIGVLLFRVRGIPSRIAALQQELGRLEVYGPRSARSSSLASPRIMPGSPADSASSFSSNNSSGESWTSNSPELFLHFNMSILLPPPMPLSMSRLAGSNPPSPRDHIDSPVMTGFEPAIGTERKERQNSGSNVGGDGVIKKGPGRWELGFPKDSLLRPLIINNEPIITDMNNPQNYRQRLSSLFRA